MPKTTTRGSLHKRTLELLKENNIPLLDIYVQTKLPYYWLKSFARGQIQDPSVNRVQQLYEYLAGQNLEV